MGILANLKKSFLMTFKIPQLYSITALIVVYGLLTSLLLKFTYDLTDPSLWQRALVYCVLAFHAAFLFFTIGKYLRMGQVAIGMKGRLNTGLYAFYYSAVYYIVLSVIVFLLSMVPWAFTKIGLSDSVFTTSSIVITIVLAIATFYLVSAYFYGLCAMSLGSRSVFASLKEGIMSIRIFRTIPLSIVTIILLYIGYVPISFGNKFMGALRWIVAIVDIKSYFLFSLIPLYISLLFFAWLLMFFGLIYAEKNK